MRRLALWLLPAALLGGQARYARLGDSEGKAEVQLAAADTWQPAVRNLVLRDGAWLRTDSGRAEIEFDDGSAFRLAADSLLELSDYTRLSTGQRITLISLDRGVGYFTGAAEARDALTVAVPGAQVTVRQGARLRLEARDDWSQIAVIEGAVLFSSPAAEITLKEGQMARVEPARPARFQLFRELTALEDDRWSEERDKSLAVTGSAPHVPGLRYGLWELDAHGTWVQSPEYGTVWKPKVAEGWAPFRHGKWLWYDDLGFTWISQEPWGWLPYHYGRWMRGDTAGWFWAPGKSAVFKPGDVYWLRGRDLAGWGPLAPGETWTAAAVPQLFLNAHTTYARLAAEAREIDPSGFTLRPRDPLSTATFVAAPPSPPLAATRLDARRPVLRAGSTRVTPHLPGVTYEAGEPMAQPREAAPAQTTVITPPPQAPPPPIVVTVPPPEQPSEIYYPVPVYTGIVIVDPPERRPRPAPPRREEPKPQPPPATPQPIVRVERTPEEPRRTRSVERPPDPPPQRREEPKPVQRTPEAPERPERGGKPRIE